MKKIAALFECINALCESDIEQIISFVLSSRSVWADFIRGTPEGETMDSSAKKLGFSPDCIQYAA